MNNLVTVRAAAEPDVEAIFRFVDHYADQGVVLRRDRDDIRHYLGNFVVAEFDGTVCGCCAVRDFGNGLWEVRSLVVDPAMQGKGIGRSMLRAVFSGLTLRHKEWRLFTLTKTPEFFRRLGFREVPRESFPEKIWADCRSCPRYECCDETALLLTSEE